MPVHPAKLSRLVSSALRKGIEIPARVDAYLKRLTEDDVSRYAEELSWRGFALFTLAGYADPTGAHAARNVDLERGNG